MRVVSASVGRLRGHLRGPVEEYEARARRYWKLDVVEVQAGLGSRATQPELVMAEEGRRLLDRIPAELELVALTRMGRAMSSGDLAGYLDDRRTGASPGVAFVIGGAFGLDEAVLQRAALQLRISDMTLPHEMARLILAEQLYRAGSILRGEPYHKG